MAGIPSGYTPLAKIGISDKGEYVSGTAYEKQDSVLYKGSTYVAIIDNPVGEPVNDGVNWRYLAKGFPDDINEVAFTFTEAANRENIQTGEKSKTIFGKIMKWLADLTAPAFAQVVTSYADMMSNTVAGYMLDALVAKQAVEEINSNLPIVLTVGKFKPQDYKFLVLNLRDQTVNSSKLNVVYCYSADWTTLSFNLYYNANMQLCSIKIKIDTSGNITFAEGYRFDTVNSTIYDYNAPTIDSIIGIK